MGDGTRATVAVSMCVVESEGMRCFWELQSGKVNPGAVVLIEEPNAPQERL